ncbi:MAG: hypothetical protein AAF307_07110 [Pseudomonadota bacterium]
MPLSFLSFLLVLLDLRIPGRPTTPVLAKPICTGGKPGRAAKTTGQTGQGPREATEFEKKKGDDIREEEDAAAYKQAVREEDELACYSKKKHCPFRCLSYDGFAALAQ